MNRLQWTLDLLAAFGLVQMPMEQWVQFLNGTSKFQTHVQLSLRANLVCNFNLGLFQPFAEFKIPYAHNDTPMGLKVKKTQNDSENNTHSRDTTHTVLFIFDWWRAARNPPSINCVIRRWSMYWILFLCLVFFNQHRFQIIQLDNWTDDEITSNWEITHNSVNIQFSKRFVQCIRDCGRYESNPNHCHHLGSPK